MTENTQSTYWTIDDLIAATQGELVGTPLQNMTGVSIDTRTLHSGDIYIAIKGDVHDGHNFVAQAFEAGSSLAIVSNDEDYSHKGPCLRVGNTLTAMEMLGVYSRKRSAARRIAITGSVGKTGTKEALKIVLSSIGQTHASERSYNNHWGVPLTLARMPEKTNFGVFEVGMNAPGEITPLSQMIEPDIAIITTIAPVHLAAFDNLDGIAAAKAEIFSGLKKGGTAILNADNHYFDYLKKSALKEGAGNIVSFGHAQEADARLLDMSVADDSISVMADIKGTKITYKIGSPGVHLVQNSLAVLAACAELNVDIALCALALADWSQGAGRGQKHALSLAGGDAWIIDESYNANPVSMAASIETLASTKRGSMGRHIAVLGDMLELGETSQKWHEELYKPLDEFGIDLVYACGPDMAHLWRILPESVKGGYAETAEGLKEMLIQVISPGDVVMVKGSNGIHLGPVVENIVNRFQKAQ